MTSTLGIVRLRSRLQRDFEILPHLPMYKLSSLSVGEVINHFRAWVLYFSFGAG